MTAGDGDEQQRAFLRSLIFLVALGLALAIQEYEGVLSWVAAAAAVALAAGSSFFVGAVAEASARRRPSSRQELAAAVGLALVAGGVVTTALVVHSWTWMLSGAFSLANAFVHAPQPREPEPESVEDEPTDYLDLAELEDELSEYQAEQARRAEVEQRDDERRTRARSDRDDFPVGPY